MSWDAFVPGFVFFTASFSLGVFTQWLRKRAFDGERRFTGRWSLRIKWDRAWAKELFGEDVTEPHSEGDCFLAFLGGVYWGLSFFKLKAGADEYAHLCVYLDSVKVEQARFSRTWHLKECYLRSAIRNQVRQFAYGPFVHYRIRFTKSSPNELDGNIDVPGRNPPCDAGSLTATRVAHASPS
jgi:hypothetical protein